MPKAKSKRSRGAKRASRAGTRARAARQAAKRPAKPPAKRPEVRRKPGRVRPTRELAAEYYRRLVESYPDARTALHHRNPYELLVATILSAQSTDVRVNMVTPALFAKYPDAAALAAADRGELEEMIHSTGFFRSKAKSLQGMAAAVVERHGGRIPDTMEELTALPGVGRKTANVVLGSAFGRNEGIVVDTHVTRVSGRLGLTRQSDPVKIERDLMPLFPREQWTTLSHLLILHGRQVCQARVPKCEVCTLNDICPSSRV